MFRKIRLKGRGSYYRIVFLGTDVICAFSNRMARNMSLVYGDTKGSLRNRKDLLIDLGIDYNNLVCAKQTHGSGIRYAQEHDRGKGSTSPQASITDTDAFITDKRDLPLAIFTADCLSVFLYCHKAPSIGLVHAGWRGTKAEIIPNAIRLMEEYFNAKAKDLYAVFGPAIRDCCYEVGGEFSNFFPYGLIKRDNRYYLDLAAINKKQLLESGVKEKNIFDVNICTSCKNKEFFSYRREGEDCGRTMSVMMLR